MQVLIARPDRGSLVLTPRENSAVGAWGVFVDAGLVGAAVDLSSHLAGRAGVWSGSLAEQPLARDVRTWGPEGMAALNEACDAGVARAAAAGGRLLVRPHARHVLSDVQRCLTFMLKRQGQPLGLLLDPAALLDSTMLGRAADHLRRAIETLGPVADAVWLTNVSGGARASLDDTDDDHHLTPVPLHRGLIAPTILLDLVRRCVPASTPLIVGSEEEASLITG